MYALDYQSALFLAALPYRSAVYRSGGWQINHVSDIHSFVRDFYRPQEISDAQGRAKALSSKRRFWLAGVEVVIEYVTLWDSEYPHFLKNIYDPPPVLFLGVPQYYVEEAWEGVRNLQKSLVVSIVGTRRANPLCRVVIDYMLERLSRQCRSRRGLPLNVVSGFAYGVDTFAHQLGLQKRLSNWAVLGSGLYHCGPYANHYLLRMAQKKRIPCILVSEFLHDQLGRAYSFPRRNRLIAGLAHLVCVIQAPRKSGALITAQYAIDEGRELWVFDHPIFQQLGVSNKGCQNLLLQGAKPLVIPDAIFKNVYKVEFAWPKKKLDDVASRAVQRQLFDRRMNGSVPLGNGYSFALGADGAVGDEFGGTHKDC